MNMKQNKNSKFVSILSSLAIGIAGSFLWEFICSPLFHSVFNIVFSAPAKVSSFIGSWYATKYHQSAMNILRSNSVLFYLCSYCFSLCQN